MYNIMDEFVFLISFIPMNIALMIFNKNNIFLFAVFCLLFATHGEAFAQNNYTCDYTLTSWNWLLDGEDIGNMPNITIHDPAVASQHPQNNIKYNPPLSLKGGDVVCVDGSVPHRFLTWKNIHGDASNPIIITNTNGQVVIRSETASYWWMFKNSTHFKILGNGDANHQYGFKITTHNNSYLKLVEKSNQFEVAHVEIAGDHVWGTHKESWFAGIMAKSQPICSDDPNGGSTDAGNFELRDISIHDNYIHDVWGEWLYIGYGKSQWAQLNGCSTINYPHHVRNISIHNNIIDNVGWDGIQLKNAHYNAKVYNNIITNYARLNIGRHDEGLFVGDGSEAEIYGNWIENGNENSNGIQINAFGNTKIYNNVVLGAGYNGLYLNNQSPSFANRDGTFEIYNNTIEGGSNSAIVTYTPQKVIIKDNIWFGHEWYFGIKKPQNGEMNNNIVEKDPSLIGFVDYQQGDIRLHTTNAGQWIQNNLAGGNFLYTQASSRSHHSNNTNTTTNSQTNGSNSSSSNNTSNSSSTNTNATTSGTNTYTNTNQNATNNTTSNTSNTSYTNNANSTTNNTNKTLSNRMKNRLDSIVSKFMSKLESKYSSNTDKQVAILTMVIKKLDTIKEKKRSLRPIINYLQEEFSKKKNNL